MHARGKKRNSAYSELLKINEKIVEETIAPIMKLWK